MKGTSLEFSKLVADKSLDLVYLDAQHAYSSILEDIKLWLPKIKSNGTLAGHDYGVGLHDGVKRAVDETFGHPDRVFPDTTWAVGSWFLTW